MAPRTPAFRLFAHLTIALGLVGLLAFATPARAAISPVAQSTAETGTGAATVDVALPAGTLPGDILYLAVRGTTTTALPLPAGWTSLYSTVSYTGYSGAYYRVAGLAEPPTLTLNLGVSRRATVVLSTWRGVDTVQPVDVHAITGNDTGNNATALAVTTTRNGDAVLVGATWGSGGATSTSPAGVTDLGIVTTSGGSAGGLTTHHGYFLRPVAGATTAKTYTSPTSLAWGTYTVALREAAPPAPSITSAPSTPGNGLSPAWAFSSSQAGDTFQCRLDRGATVIFTWATCTSAKTYSLAGQVDGTYTFSVRAVSAAGNVGPATTSTYALDTVAPAAPSITSAPATPGSGRNPAWSFSGPGGASLECRLVRGGTIVSDWGACVSPKSFDLSLQADGTYTFSVRAVDPAGNASAAVTGTYVLDSTAPVAPAISSSPTSPATGRSPSWSFSAEVGTATECRLDRGGVAVAGWAACSSPKGYDLTGLPDGVYTFSVRATDVAGNVGATATSDYTLDTTAPAAPTIGSAPSSPGNDLTPTWSFSGEAGANLECRLVRGGTTIAGWAACTDPRTFDLTGEPDGTYTFSVRAIDAAGNVGAIATSNSTLDTAAPAAPTISSSPTSPGADRSPSWSFSAEAGANVECRLVRGATVVADWGTCAGTRTFDLSLEAEGAYTFSVRATDAAGNVGAVTTSAYTLDTTAPVAPSISSAPSSPATGRSPSWSFSAEVGTSTECRLDRGATVVAGWAACAGGKSFDLSGLPDGTYTFSVRATDAAGNLGAAATSNYTLDTTAPAAPTISSSPSSPGSSRSPSWSFSGEAGASLECRLVRGGTAVSDWAACTDPRTFDLTGQPDGVYTFSVRATDAAGNVGAAATGTYTLDTSAPAAPSISSPPASPGADRSPEWAFTAEAGASVDCRLVRGGTTVSDWAPCASPEPFDLSLEPDGTYTFSVRATDAAGNVGAVTTSAYTLDTLAPDAPVLSAWPASPGPGHTPSWSFSAEPGAGMECRLVRGATTVSDWAACASPKPFDLTSEPDGTYTFSVRATDAAGNVSADTTSVYALDSSAPVAPSITAAPSSPGIDESPTWSFTGEVGAVLECRLDRGATAISGWTSCDVAETFDLSNEADGVYTFSVRAIDGAGNPGPVATSGYTLDTTAPATPAFSGEPASPASGRSPSWSFTGDAGARLECRLDRGATVVSGWATCSSPKAFDLTGKPDGTYTMSVQAIDAAGNVSGAATSAYVLDTSAPAAPSISSSPPTPDNDPTPAWQFTAEAGASTECQLERGTTVVAGWAACSSPEAFDLTGEPDGAYTFSVRATDAAGNVGAIATGTYTLDTTAPAAPSITSAPASPATGRNPSWSFSAEAGASVECRLDRGTTVVAGWAACAATKSFDLSGRTDGTYTFSVRATDASGNTGATATSDYTLDTTGPAAPSISTTPSSPGNDETPSWAATAEAGAAVECRLDRGATVIAGWGACAGTKTFDLSAEPDGAYTYSVRATDTAGNVGATATSGYTLDTAAPAAPTFSAQPTSPASGRSPAWSFSGEAGAALECRLDRGTTAVSGWAACVSPRAFDLALQPDGVYTVSVRATDAAGNTGAVATSSYTLDSVAPTAPTVTASASSPGNDETPAWSFTADAGATVECRLDRGATAVSGWTACSSPQAFSLVNEPDGAYTFSVRATDAAGNTGAVTTSAYTLDTSAPAAPSITAAPSWPDNDVTPSWSFTAEAGASVQCRLDRGATVIAGWAACAGAKTFDLSAEPDGAYTFSVRATDAAGNAGAIATSGYTLDTGGPAAPSFTAQPASPASGRGPTWSFMGEAGAGFECRVARGVTTVSAWAACASPKAADLTLQPDGVYTISVRATDVAGNTGAVATTTYTLDSVAPPSPSITAAPASPGASRSPGWTFSTEAGATAECRLDRGATVVGGWAPCAGGESFSLVNEPDGAYTFSVRATDAAGNTGATATSAYTLDTGAPAAPSITAAPSWPDNDVTPSWSFTAEAGAAVECRLDRGATVVAGWAACAGTRSFDLSARADGVYTFSVRATDSSGNVGATASSAYTLDTAAPAAPAFSAQPASPASDRGPAWSFSGEGGATFECRVARGATTVADWTACASPETVDLALQPDGDYTLSVRATDPAGNTGAAATGSYTLDASAPGAPTVTSAPATPGNDTTPTWSFAGEAGAGEECRIARGATVVADWAACSTPATFDLAGEPDGDYTFSIRDVDAAGNAGQPATSAYRLDTATPAAPSIDAAPATPGNDQTPTWSVSGEAGASLECRIARGATVVADWAACAGPRTYSLSLEPDGTYTFSVRATDAAGNTSATATRDYELSTARPPAPTIDAAAASPGHDAAPAWSFSGRPGDTFECRLLLADGTVLADWAACTSPHTDDLLGRADGAYDFAVRARTPAGTTGPQAVARYAYDTTAPSVPSIDAAPASPGNQASTAWSFSAEAGATFECRLDRGATSVAGWAPCAGAKAYTLGGEPDGTYTFSVRATDGAGNTGPAATSEHVRDTSAPAAPAFTATPGSIGRSRRPKWSLRAEAGTTLECRLDRGSTAVSGWSSCAGTRTYDLGGQPDGRYVISVRAADAIGNIGPAATSDYTLDTTPPAAPAIDAAPAGPAANVTPAWSFSGEDGASFECRLEGGQLPPNAAWERCPSPRGYDLGGQPDGVYAFSVRATDRAGNVGAASTAGYQLLVTAPGAPTIEASPGPTGNSASPAWSFAPSAPGETPECRLETGEVAVVDWGPCATPFVYDLAGRPDGIYTFSVRTHNLAGTPGPTTSSAYVLDTSPPATPTIDASNDPLGNDRDPAWRFAGEAGSAFECRLARGATVLADWAGCASGRAYDLAGQPDGTYEFAVRGRDGAGNVSAVRGAAYELDTTPPATPAIEDKPDRDGLDRTPTWSFSDEKGVTYECRLERGDDRVSGWTPCTSPQSYDLGDKPDGEYTFFVRATDGAGNVGTVRSVDYRLARSSSAAAGGRTDDTQGSAPAQADAPASPESSAAAPADGDAASPRRESAGSQATPAAGSEKPGDRPAGSVRDGGAQAAPAAARRAAARAAAAEEARKRHAKHHKKDAPAAVKALGDVARSVGKAAAVAAENADKSVFPGALLLIVLAFLSIQGRMDRNDPKLALAPAFADPDLDFGPPPSRERS